ncbi:MAG TPA: beta-propeller fold lactonase family protein, partial [Mycobacterium sp.]|nr:beta-propeller fold lactonase family protein [Mycobacterium sp.]
MRSTTIIAPSIIGLYLLGGCSGGGDTALTTVPTAHLAITFPAMTVTAGTPFTFTVKALDATGTVVPTYIGTVHITTSDTAAKLPANATLAQGVGTFTVTFNTAGNQTITASDTVGDASSGTSPAVSVKPIPVPTIVSLSPAMTGTGGAGFTLIVNGSNFVPTSVVQWNGSNRTTAFVSSSRVTAQILATDIATAGAATVTVFNPAPGGGGSMSFTFTITTPTGPAADPQSIAVDRSGKFAYVLDGAPSVGWAQVSMYAIDSTTGTLTSIGPPVSTNGFGLYPGVITVDPSGKFAYVVNEGDPWGYEDGAAGSVAMYTIDATTGALTFTGLINGTGDIDGSCPGLCNPGSMVVDPSGKFAYVGTGAAGLFYGVAMYTIDATTGALTSIGKVAATAAPSSVATDPAGKFVYVAIPNVTPGSAGSVSMYAVNATGALVSVGTITVGSDPSSVAVDPSGKFAYVTNFSSNDVSMYTINATTGALISVGTIGAGTGPGCVAVDPSGKFAYV